MRSPIGSPPSPATLISTSHPAPYTRKVAVYVPKQYVPGTAAPFIVGADGLLQPGSPRLSNVQMLGASIAVGFFQEHSLHRLGVTGSTGFGRTVIPAAPDASTPGAPPLRAVEATQTFVYVFWSSSFRYGEGRDTRDLEL